MGNVDLTHPETRGDAEHPLCNVHLKCRKLHPGQNAPGRDQIPKHQSVVLHLGHVCEHPPTDCPPAFHDAFRHGLQGIADQRRPLHVHPRPTVRPDGVEPLPPVELGRRVHPILGSADKSSGEIHVAEGRVDKHRLGGALGVRGQKSATAQYLWLVPHSQPRPPRAVWQRVRQQGRNQSGLHVSGVADQLSTGARAQQLVPLRRQPVLQSGVRSSCAVGLEQWIHHPVELLHVHYPHACQAAVIHKPRVLLLHLRQPHILRPHCLGHASCCSQILAEMPARGHFVKDAVEVLAGQRLRQHLRVLVPRRAQLQLSLPHAGQRRRGVQVLVHGLIVGMSDREMQDPPVLGPVVLNCMPARVIEHTDVAVGQAPRVVPHCQLDPGAAQDTELDGHTLLRVCVRRQSAVGLEVVELIVLEGIRRCHRRTLRRGQFARKQPAKKRNHAAVLHTPTLTGLVVVHGVREKREHPVAASVVQGELELGLHKPPLGAVRTLCHPFDGSHVVQNGRLDGEEFSFEELRYSRNRLVGADVVPA
mmetsp:Transcript_10979/g.27667  ORF Transcript_10979/g.27667 Transcript_10979/m.27667 type:complete len:532 (-) Transcript_10979:441-2036(-)